MHRKHFQDLTSRTTFHIKKSVIPYVVALGELDPYRTVPVKLWRGQKESFQQVLVPVYVRTKFLGFTCVGHLYKGFKWTFTLDVYTYFRRRVIQTSLFILIIL